MPGLLQITRMLRQSKPRYLTTPRATTDSLSLKIFLVVIVPVLSFLGATAGTFITSRVETARWERQMNYATQQALLNKRIDLLDRSVRLWNRRHAAYLLNFDVENTGKVLGFVLKADMLKKEDFDESKHQKAFDRMLAERLQLADLSAEFGSVMTLDALYFGPKTKETVRNIAKTSVVVEGHWWDVDDKSVNTLGDAMYQELNP